MSKRRSRIAVTIVAALITGAVVAPFAHGGDTTVGGVVAGLVAIVSDSAAATAL